MDERYFTRLMGYTDPRAPSVDVLWNILQRELKHLTKLPDDIKRCEDAFRFSFEGHARAPLRDSGEAYFFHVFRAAIREIRAQQRLGVYDLEVIIIILLHDCVEDAAKAGFDPNLQREEIEKRFGLETSYDVLCLTKKPKEEETNDQYCNRLLRCDTWRPLVAKQRDREDNMRTIGGVPHTRRVKKILETQKNFPAFQERLETLIEREIGKGHLDAAWRYVPQAIYSSLFAIVRLQKRKYNIP